MAWRIAASGLLLASLLTVVCSQTEPVETFPGNYLILAPNTIRPGFPFTISASIYSTQGTSRTVTLKSVIYKGRDVVVQSTDTLQIGTNSVTLQVPTTALPVSDYTLVLSGTGGLGFNNTDALTFNVEHFSIFVQSDKAIYKPGQTIQFRVMAIYPNLRPYVGNFTVTVNDANGNVIQQWLNRAPNKNGIISDSVVMSDHPVLGIWTIKAEAEGQTYDYTFQIDEYVLPKFEVTVSLPSFFDLSDAEVPVTVSAKYTYGKPVEGSYSLTISQSYYSAEIKITGQTDGSSVVTVSRSQLIALKNQNFRGGSVDLYSGDQFNFAANVTESLTGITQSSDPSKLSFSNYPIKVEFSDSVSRSNFKPGLPYQAYLVVSHQDGSPLSEVERARGITLSICDLPNCYDRAAEWSSQRLTIAPNTGVVEAFIPTTAGNENQLTLTAEYQGVMTLARGATMPSDVDTYGTATGDLGPGEYRTSASKSLRKSRSSSGVFIQVRAESSSALTVGTEATFIVESTTSPGKLSYQIISRGNIIHTETIEGVAESYTLQRTITADMSPKSKLLVSFIGSEGEVILDSLEFVVNVVFDNPVSVNFTRLSAEPGDNVNFDVETTPGAFVGILTVDKSVLLLADGNDITQFQVLESVSKFDTTSSNSGGYNPFVNRFWCFFPYYTSGETAGEIIRNAGIIYATDGFVYNARGTGRYTPFFSPAAFPAGGLFPVAADAGLPDEGAVQRGGDKSFEEKNIRKDFPETWLWVDTEADSSGRVSVQTQFPDTITSWVGTAISMDATAGLGVTENAAEAIVLKKFFVSLNLPYSVVRGEKLVVSATVFNYLDQSINARVQLQGSDQYVGLNLTKQNEVEVSGSVTKDVTVEANKGATVRFPIKPTKNGMMELVVTATSGMQQDGVRRFLRVEPEGVAQEYVDADLVDLSNSVDGSYSKTFSITLPTGDLVPDSVRASVTATGDIMGPTMSNLDELLRLPTGCGEQTMIAFAPDVFVYKYLTEVGKSNPTIEDQAINFMKTGYQNELTFQHGSGAFSAFGDSDGAEGSTWLTAFVVRSFLQAAPYIYIDPAVVERALEFLNGQQSRDGSYRSSGRVIHRDMEGGVSSVETLTAFVAIAMHEASTSEILSAESRSTASNSLNSAANYLVGRKAQVENDVYAMTIITYTLVLANSPQAPAFRTILGELQTNEADGSLRYWTNQAGEQKTPADRDFFLYPSHGPPSADVEMTAYALLAYLDSGDMDSSVPIARWLSQQRNSIGGYSSTQDTVMGLFALTTYASMVSSTAKDLTMSITTSADSTYREEFTIRDDNSVVLQQFELPIQDGDIVVQGSGQGSFLLSFVLHYNVMAVKSKDVFDIGVNILKDQTNSIAMNVCSRYTGDGEGTGMGIVEVGIPSGFFAEVDALAQAVSDHEFATQYEILGQKAVIYFNEIPSFETCIMVEAQRSMAVAESMPSNVRVYDYYKPAEQKVMSYQPDSLKRASVCNVCPDCCGTGGASPASPPSSFMLLISLTVFTILTSMVI